MNYEKKAKKPAVRESRIYETKSLYADPSLRDKFLLLKASVCDMNPALIKKCITGTEQDFFLLMKKAQEYAKSHFPNDEDKLLSMFRECVFGYYILSPLIEKAEVSDIKVLSWDHITVKAGGKRYLSNLIFFDKKDFEDWLSRRLRIGRLNPKGKGLLHTTDRKGARDYYLRIDYELLLVTSKADTNVHIRKIPKEKLTWEYLRKNDMLSNDLEEYIKDRITAGYGFLISGRGGSGKSTLLNSMIDEIPFDESVLVVQESDELYSNIHPQIQFEHTVESGDGSQYSLEDELRMGLLQDIDNFVIGEIKGGEALYVFTTAMSTGARFFGTIHANDAKSSVRRLCHLARYVSDYPVSTLEEMLCGIPFVLIHLHSFAIDEMVEIEGFDEDMKRPIYKTIFERRTL